MKKYRIACLCSILFFFPPSLWAGLIGRGSYEHVEELDSTTMDSLDLKPLETLMKGIEVKARARSFTTKGDTIVFNPAAFYLPEGAYLEDLISKLPGFKYVDGKLSWNGRPVRVLVNGENLFGDSELKMQLPVETIDKLKAYDKASEFSERTGKDDGQEDLVLDVSIKQKFLDKWYGNTALGYQTPAQYMADAVVHRLSVRNPVMVTGDVNNLSQQHRRVMGDDQTSRRKGFGREQYGAGGYQHNWQQDGNQQTLKSSCSASGGLGHSDWWQTRYTDTENFFPGQDYNYVTSSDYNYRHAINPYLDTRLHWAADAHNTLTVRILADQKDTREREERKTVQFYSNPYETYETPLLAAFDLAAPEECSVRSHSSTHNKGRQQSVEIQSGWTHYITDGSLSLDLGFGLDKHGQDATTLYRIENLPERSMQVLNQAAHNRNKARLLTLQAKGRRWIGKNWLLDLSYKLSYKTGNERQDFAVSGSPDAANSFHDSYRQEAHETSLVSTIKSGSLQLYPLLSAIFQREETDYARGRLDTAAVRRSTIWKPGLRATYKISKTSSLEAEYKFQTTQPQLLRTLEYKDDTDPMFIRKGNSGLKDSHANNLVLSYSTRNSKRQFMLNASVNISVSDRAVQDVLCYDRLTAVYTASPEMVKGPRSSGMEVLYDQTLGGYFRIRSRTSLRLWTAYGYLTRTAWDEPLQINRQFNLSPDEDFTFIYNHPRLECSAFVRISANKLDFSLTPGQNTTLWENRLGVSTSYRYGAFSVSTRLTEQIRQGYHVDAMNRHYLLWNASMSYKFLSNRARLTLEADDILNNMDSFTSMQASHSQTFSRYDQMHHYLSIAFTYNFDAKKQ